MEARQYYGFSGWDGDDYGTVGKQFRAEVGPEPELVYAVYSTLAYEGSADVVFRRDGKWFHNQGGHCSCYGLEDQWAPEELDPTIHLRALQEGKKELLVFDSQGDCPEATQENFDTWLAWAVKQPRP